MKWYRLCKDAAAKLSKTQISRIKAVAFLCGICLIAMVYFTMSHYFGKHFYFGTIINGVSSGRESVTQVKERLMKEVSQYSLTLILRDGKKEVISGSQIGYTCGDYSQVEKLIQEQNPFAWILHMGKSRQYNVTLPVYFKIPLLDEELKNMECFQPDKSLPPQNASIIETDSGYQIKPEEQGTTLKYKETKEAITKAIQAGKPSVNLEQLDLYEKPVLLRNDKDLQWKVARLNELTGAHIVFDFNDRQMKVDRAAITQMLVTEGKDYVLDESKVLQWVGQMAYETDTYGLPHNFKKHDGSMITLPRGGNYGWCINIPATTEALLKAIKENYTGNMEPVYLYTGKDRSKNDIGATYVEISISEQRMWFYKEGVQLVDTSIVTGNPNRGNETPSNNVWAIAAIINGKVLTGEDYKQPVTYWLPFNGNVGIHDADSFRPYYGGDIYWTNGSHGCINTPDWAAKTIFDNVEVGTPVVVYD